MGYDTIGLTANTWYLVAPQFKQVSATTDIVDLLGNVTFTGLQAVPFASRATGAQIQIYDSANEKYSIYYYISDSKNGTAWAKSKNVVPETIPLSLGEGFWFKTGTLEGDTASLRVLGSVKSEISKTINVGVDGEWMIACNPYPVALSWDNVTTSLEAKPFANRNTDCAQIQVYDAANEKYSIYYNISDSKNGTAWAKTKNTLATGTMAEAGQAFWVKAPTSGSLTFTFSN